MDREFGARWRELTNSRTPHLLAIRLLGNRLFEAVAAATTRAESAEAGNISLCDQLAEAREERDEAVTRAERLRAERDAFRAVFDSISDMSHDIPTGKEMK